MKTLYNKARNDQWELSEVCMTVTARYGTGGGNTPIVMTYQDVTGTLNPGAHPGSYNGQDAYNDMLVTDYERTDSNGIRSGKRRNYAGGVPNIERKP